MASFMIHLAAANEYLKNHDIDNKEDFILGVLAVDLAQDRIKSHYTKYTDKTDLLKFLSGKVSLEDYLHENNVDTDYDKGIFFHLITDYEFYTNFLNKEKIERLDYTTFKEYIYHDYESVNNHVKSKYGVILPEKIKKYDYTSYDDDVPYYTMIVTEDGNKIKLLLDLTEEMLHTIKTQHPQKVYFA